MQYKLEQLTSDSALEMNPRKTLRQPKFLMSRLLHEARYMTRCSAEDATNLEPLKHDRIEWFPLNDIPEPIAAFTAEGLRKLRAAGDLLPVARQSTLEVQQPV